MEAEYIALSHAMRDLIPIKRTTQEIFKYLGKQLQQTEVKCTLFEDNQACLQLASVPKMTPRSKHIGIKYHFFREHVKNGFVQVKAVALEHNKADIFTKGLGETDYRRKRLLISGWDKDVRQEGVSENTR